MRTVKHKVMLHSNLVNQFSDTLHRENERTNG